MNNLISMINVLKEAIPKNHFMIDLVYLSGVIYGDEVKKYFR